MNDKIFPVAKNASELPPEYCRHGNVTGCVHCLRYRSDRRERIATAAMQGLIAYLKDEDLHPNEMVPELAVEYADLLIAKLDSRGDSK